VIYLALDARALQPRHNLLKITRWNFLQINFPATNRRIFPKPNRYQKDGNGFCLIAMATRRLA